VTVGMLWLGIWPSPPMVVTMNVKNDECAEAATHVIVDAVQLRVKVIVLVQGPLNKLTVRPLLPDFQSPSVFGHNINSFFSRPIQIYFESGFFGDDVVLGRSCEIPGIRILFAQSIIIAQVQ
jgi:hypothetical protein